MDLTAVLKRVPIFRDLDDHELAPFLHRCHLRTLPAEVLVFAAGDDGDALYVVLDGAVKVFLGDESGREVIFCLERRGGYFGELSMLDGRPRSASVMTTVPTRLLVITRSAFCDVLNGRPDAAYHVITGLTTRVRTLTSHVCSLAMSNVRQRVVSALMRLAEPHDGAWLIRERPSHQDVADMIGASREMTGRIMRELSNDGHISMSGRRMTLYDSIHESPNCP